MPENGKVISVQFQGLKILHVHKNTPLGIEAFQVVTRGETVLKTRHPLLAAVQGLLGLIGHTQNTGAIPIPGEYNHSGSQNVTFRSLEAKPKKTPKIFRV
ncbi:hypothetical protein HY214_01705 [Candidatus Roizmanbacteria bacterium]|nr:hypothetical protein [Candidatus Roizmanbacteria bacterium]